MNLKSRPMLRPMIVVVFSAAFVSPTLASVVQTSKITPYKIAGNTVEEVRQQMSLKGPRDGNTPKASHIGAKVRWGFRTQMAGSNCIITDVKVTVSIIRTVPELNTNNNELRSQFARYRKLVDAFQEGHAKNAQSMARQMDRGIAALPPAASCDDLKRSVEQLGNRLTKETAAANREYSERTEYGRTLGAVWPPLEPKNGTSQPGAE
ncbi:DUF922 domain-containing protein [Microvirga rosea]|uniref:DUF922 domain-containing protein n=1 Tax=Microvirga rosea TaxID=2715425 RepID=UPI001D09C545|nr:DUF922 domain-containing protein [Microvirga rosea]MCB8823284.1 DUF922 domain-containing Zn-dependent protease [Microvirga rosea]